METEKELGMRWHNFLVKFLLWAWMVLNVITGLMMLTGSQYGNQTEAVYKAFSSLRTLDILIGLLCFGIAAFDVYVRQRLAGFNEDGPKLLMCAYLAQILSDLLYALIFSAITKMPLGEAIEVPSLVASAAPMIYSINYYKKRKHMFAQFPRW